MASIGVRLRELRQKRQLTLKEVAEETGFAVSYLSQLERDMVSISVDNLERLALFYEVHMVHFFQGQQANPVLLTRRAQIEKSLEVELQGPAAVTLLTNRSDARLEPMLVTISPGQEEPHFRQHDADTLVYVLSGRARLLSEQGEEIDLDRGDLACYVNIPRRRILNASDEQPLLLLVITAPPTSSLDQLIDMRRGMVVQTVNP